MLDLHSRKKKKGERREEEREREEREREGERERGRRPGEKKCSSVRGGNRPGRYGTSG